MSANVPGVSARVVLVLVSHSALLARGCADVAAQMAPDVRVVALGGDPQGGIGTNAGVVREALAELTLAGLVVVVLTDLGSAVMAAELAVELLDPDAAARVRVVDGPFVEGAVAAAVAAQVGGGLEEVATAALGGARSGLAPEPGVEVVTAVAENADGRPGSLVAHHASVTLGNSLGLHARPAAALARLVAGFEAEVRVDGVDAASVIELMKLGASGRRELTVTATGPAAGQAVAAVVAAISSGFGER